VGPESCRPPEREPDKPLPPPGWEPAPIPPPGWEPRSAPAAGPARTAGPVPPWVGTPLPPGGQPYAAVPPAWNWAAATPSPAPGASITQPDISTDAGRQPLALLPMDLGDVLDGAITVYRANARAILLVTAVLLVPLSFLSAFAGRAGMVNFQALTSTDTPPTAPTVNPVSTYGLTALQLLVVVPLLLGLLTWIVVESCHGRPARGRDALRAVAPRIWTLLACVATPVMAAGLPFAASLALGTWVHPGFFLLTMLVALPLGAFVFVRCLGSIPAAVIDNTKALPSLRRSWSLSRRCFWRTLGTFVLAELVVSVAGGFLSLPFQIAGLVLGSKGWALVGAADFLSGLVSQPYLAGVVVLLVLDQRIRKEGYDLALAAAELDLAT